MAIEQVPIAVGAAWLEGDGDLPAAVTIAFELGVLGRPLVELSAQRHAVSLNVRGKGEGDVDVDGLSGSFFGRIRFLRASW